MPWAADDRFIVGEFAKNQGRKVPVRLVHSAKSWLCHSGVDRNAAILPWGAPNEILKMSPVEASAHYLHFLAASWTTAAEIEKPCPILRPADCPDRPGFFDEVARELTMQAASPGRFDRCGVAGRTDRRFLLLDLLLSRPLAQSDHRRDVGPDRRYRRRHY